LIDQPPRDGRHSSIAWLNTASLAFDGAVKPLSLRTNCSDAARDFLVGRRRIKVEERLDVSAHGCRYLLFVIRSSLFPQAPASPFLFRFLLRAAGALREHGVAHHHFDVKQLAVVGPELAGDAIRRQRRPRLCSRSWSRDL